MAVRSDYVKGLASDHKDLLSIIVGWATKIEDGEPVNTFGLWEKVQDYVDSDGERCVILKRQNPDELPIYIGLKTFEGYPDCYQQGIQINAYTSFSPDLEWDCQAGSIATPENYNSENHFYENCPAILVGNQPVCFWLHIDEKRIVCLVRTPVVPLVNDMTKIRQSFVNEMFYLGWGKRLVPREGYPYPMIASGTTHTLGKYPTRLIQRNFAYDNVYGSLRHIPPFYWDYMQYEGIQSLVYFWGMSRDQGNGISLGKRWPQIQLPNDSPDQIVAREDLIPIDAIRNNKPLCGPKDNEVTACFKIPAIPHVEGEDIPTSCMVTKQGIYAGKTIFTYDQFFMANRGLYFDGIWGWYFTNPIHNSYIKSLCVCLAHITECESHNYLNELGQSPGYKAYAIGITKDQLMAHFGWLPSEVVESFNNHRLLVPCYYSLINSVMEMQSWTREEFGDGGISYDEEQYRMQIAGVLDGLYFVPGLGLAAQDILKVSTPQGDVKYLVIQDIYRTGAFNLATFKLGIKEWTAENPGLDIPRDLG